MEENKGDDFIPILGLCIGFVICLILFHFGWLNWFLKLAE